jgi:glycosyltransferase involved in cell wall biosynthesis
LKQPPQIPETGQVVSEVEPKPDNEQTAAADPSPQTTPNVISDLYPKMPISISVFFPCYNEQANVERTVNRAIETLEKISADYQIIIVNDGSSDDTGKIADKIAAENRKVKVVHHKTNLGYGSAIRSGIKASVKNLIFFTDGDGQFDINELLPLLPLISSFDIVSCFRINRKDNFLRRLDGFCWTKLVCLLFGLKVRDIDCAFKLFKKEVFDQFELVSAGALISAEILARAARKGFSITQVGVHHYPRTAGNPTGAKLTVIFRAFWELFRLYGQIRRS